MSRKPYIAVVDSYRNSQRKIMVHEFEMPNQEAKFAMELIGKWGLVAAEPDGEDSGGRQKFQTLAPAATASRACDIAEATYAEFRKRDWIIEMPEVKEVFDDKEEK